MVITIIEAITAVDDGGGGGATIVSPVTTNNTTITAAAGWTFISIRNGTGSAFTINLPAMPNAQQLVSIMDELGNAGTYPITINGNGNNIMAYGTSASTLVLNADAAAANPLVWDNTTGIWALFGGM